MKKYFLILGACIVLGSCSTGEAAISSMMQGDSSQAPVFLGCRAVSEREVEFEFSKPVKVTSLAFDPAMAIESVEEGSTVKVILKETAEPGMMITADLLAEDERRNTINVLVPFRARNNRMPVLVINEIRTDYSNPRVEFVEFKIKTAGNLGAMRVFLAGSSQKPTIYEFSPVEVNKDEYMTLHLRKREEDCKDEYSNDLAESGGTGSSPHARDFWVPGIAKLINKTGVVYVMDQDDKVLDAVMFSENPDSWWTKDYLAETAEFLFSQGVWKSVDGKICGPQDAVSSQGTTATRTICRDETAEKTNTKTNWYITATSGATPGTPNNPKRYEP
ncbi:MAG: hypothetical protein LBI12_01085 [Treponema sp.]|nr:hypothetical protein [Treponema sp.]